MIFYTIFNKKTNKWSRGGSGPEWADKFESAKFWKGIGQVKNHLRLVRLYNSEIEDWSILPIEVLLPKDVEVLSVKQVFEEMMDKQMIKEEIRKKQHAEEEVRRLKRLISESSRKLKEMEK